MFKTNYERILEALLYAISDPELGLDLSNAQVETLAEIATDETNEIVKETKEALKTQLQHFINLV